MSTQKAGIIEAETTAVNQAPSNQAPAVVTPNQMLMLAIEKGADMATIEKFMDLSDRFEANMARKAFVEAVAKFKANPPSVSKDKENKQFGSRYASIGNLVNTVSRELSKHGLSASWTQQTLQSKDIEVTCKLTHVLGHSESSTLIAAPDKSGSKNDVQQIKSTITYLRVTTFESVTGVIADNTDDDGNSAASVACISDAQILELESIMEDNEIDKDAFLKHYKIESLSDIPAASFNKARSVLMERAKNKGSDK